MDFGHHYLHEYAFAWVGQSGVEQILCCSHLSVSLLSGIRPHPQLFQTCTLASEESERLARASHNTVISSLTLSGDSDPPRHHTQVLMGRNPRTWDTFTTSTRGLSFLVSFSSSLLNLSNVWLISPAACTFAPKKTQLQQKTPCYQLADVAKMERWVIMGMPHKGVPDSMSAWHQEKS